MAVPLRQALKIGFYIFQQKLKRRKKYPLVLMLEPLFRCNLECVWAVGKSKNQMKF